MSKILRLVFLVFITFQFTPIQAQQKSAKSNRAGLLWEISGSGLNQTSYLFGTYHLMGKDFLSEVSNFETAFNKASRFVAEVEISNQQEMAQRIVPLMQLETGKLNQILTATEYAEVDSFLQLKLGMSIQMLDRMKPAAIQMMIVVSMAPKTVTQDSPGLDIHLQSEARAKGKKVLGFETVEEQAAIIFGMTLERQKELLLTTIREHERMIEEGKHLFNLYKSQDLNAIHKAFEQNTDYTPHELQLLINDRNQRWVKQMFALMKDGSTFFAVGAAHLPGEEGLIMLLRKNGYTVRPLP